MNLKGKRVLVIGLGISGRAAARFLLRRGALVTGVDSNADLLKSNQEVGKLCEEGMHVCLDANIDSVDLVVVSPGVAPSHPLYAAALQNGIEVIGEIELASYAISQKCLAVTGTNGKTTVTLMVAHVLNHCGISAIAVGNVGTPLASIVDSNIEEKWLVIELSSFQLDTLKNRFIDAAVILNITPDHLDRYETLDAYAASKAHISNCLKKEGQLFIEEKCRTQFPRLFMNPSFSSYGYHANCAIYTDQKKVFHANREAFILPAFLQNKVSHDIENLMAAYALCQYAGVEAHQFIEAIASFKKPSHRIEFVRTLRGVHYYDDSKGTNIDAVVRALQTLDGSVLLIAGGVDKGAPYTPWLKGTEKKLKKIFAIGEAKEKIKGDLNDHIPVELFDTLDDAVANASCASEPGDTVLLSPGCSSYDMFRDYKHRGEEFQRIVNAL